MHKLKSAKIYFCFAVLLFVAKPFLGFAFVSRSHPPAPQSILVKAFTKRKLELSGDSSHKIANVQRNLANPINDFVLSLTFLSGVIIALALKGGNNITHGFLNHIWLSLSPQRHTYLLNSTLII